MLIRVCINTHSSVLHIQSNKILLRALNKNAGIFSNNNHMTERINNNTAWQPDDDGDNNDDDDDMSM